MFRHYPVLFRELVFITSASYINISVAAVGNTIVLPTAAIEIQLYYQQVQLKYNCFTNSCI